MGGMELGGVCVWGGGGGGWSEPPLDPPLSVKKMLVANVFVSKKQEILTRICHRPEHNPEHREKKDTEHRQPHNSKNMVKVITPDRRQSKTLLTINKHGSKIAQKVFLIVICPQSGVKCQSKTVSSDF